MTGLATTVAVFSCRNLTPHFSFRAFLALTATIVRRIAAINAMDEDIIGHNSSLSSLTPIGSLGHISSPCEGDGVEVFGEASELGFSCHGEDDQLPALFCNRELFIRLK